jgi:hypothetical protein
LKYMPELIAPSAKLNNRWTRRDSVAGRIAVIPQWNGCFSVRSAGSMPLYVPAEKRLLGYFALPVLAGDEVVAAIDLKAERRQRRLAVQKWTWVTQRRVGTRPGLRKRSRASNGFQCP